MTREITKAAPEVIILAWTATGERADPRRTLENPRWRDVPAIKNRRVVVIRDELLNTPGPPLIDGARALLRHSSGAFAMKTRRAQTPPSRSTEPLVVVAALIESRGRILACQRRKNDAFGLKWEFPGGKVQPGEQPAQALARELKKKSSASRPQLARSSIALDIATKRCPREIELIFFAAHADGKRSRNLTFEQMRSGPPRGFGGA